jgi:DNA-binding NtrC family response regulator
VARIPGGRKPGHAASNAGDPARPTAWSAIALPDEGLDLTKIVANMERTILEQALRKTGGNKAQAAGMLRLKRTTLSAKLRSLSAARIA